MRWGQGEESRALYKLGSAHVCQIALRLCLVTILWGLGIGLDQNLVNAKQCRL